jgi:Ca2+-binding RTX toxin-like protein
VLTAADVGAQVTVRVGFTDGGGSAEAATSAPTPIVTRDGRTGGPGNDTLTGNDLRNPITGNDGNDSLVGLGADDSLFGGAGNDTLAGGAGADLMDGGAGDDLYVLDGADTLTEAAGGGTDTVQAGVTFTLGANFENLVLTGGGANAGTGNAGANRITGNGAANTLNGGGGADVLVGLGGNDTYVTDGGDTITEGATGGRDTVRSSVSLTLGANLENLVLTGSGNLNGTGNGLANAITGNGGRNVLNGGLGADVLIGGAGRDAFVFNTAISAGNIDRIDDFRAVDDIIHIDNAVFRGLANGVLAGAAFRANTSGNAGDASDRIIHDRDSGRLFFDADGSGSGAKRQFAVVDPNLVLTAADFLVI